MNFDPNKPIKFRNSTYPVRIVYISNLVTEYPFLSVYQKEVLYKLNDYNEEQAIWHRRDGSHPHSSDFDLVNIDEEKQDLIDWLDYFRRLTLSLIMKVRLLSLLSSSEPAEPDLGIIKLKDINPNINKILNI